MKIKALIAARSGSTRVINKNIRPFAGSTLLEVKIKQLKRISNLDGVVVNSNDDEILEIANRCGAETVRRDPYFASNSVLMNEVYCNMAENMKDCDVIVYANCTNPLINDKTIFDIIEFYKSHSNEYDSVNSAHLIKEFLFYHNKPVNYELKHMPRSQDLPDYCALNFAVNVLSRETMISLKNVVGMNPYTYVIDEVEATDIDNQIDFDFSEFVFKKYYNQK